MAVYDEECLEETLSHAFSDDEYYNVPKGIRRHDFANAHGWWVRISRDRVMFRQLYSDGVSGSIQLALRDAILYRHEVLSSFPVTIKKVYSRGLDQDPSKRIKRYEEKGNKRPYIYWKARWYGKNHEIQTENFSVYKYGEENAKAFAFEAARDRHNKKHKLTKVADPYLIQKYEPTSRADVEIWATINNKIPSPSRHKSKDEVNNDPFAFEGERKLVLHKTIERDRNLREKKISQFIEKNGGLFCELCHFNFQDNYPFLKANIIEVHHISPLATLTKNTKVKLSDLMLLCSNCHFAVHQGDAEDNLILAMEHFEKQDAMGNDNR